MSESICFEIVLLCVVFSGVLAVLTDSALRKWKDSISGRSFCAAAMEVTRFITHCVPKWVPFPGIPLVVWLFSTVALFAYQTGILAGIPHSPLACVLTGSGISALVVLLGIAFGAENIGRPTNRRALDRYNLFAWPLCFYALAELADHTGAVHPKPVLSGYLLGLATAAAAIGLFIYVQCLVRRATDGARQTGDATSARHD